MGKTLWILNHYAISPDMPGGTRHFDLARELVKKGHDVTIFASGFDHSTRKYVKIKPEEKTKVETYDGVRFVWINTFPYQGNDWRRVANMLSYGWRVLRCDRGIPKPDVVIGSSMHPFAALAGWWLASRHKARFIFEVRDLWPQVLVDMGAMSETNLVVKLLRKLERFLYVRSDRVIVLGTQMKKYIARYGINQGKIVWIPNGVVLSRFDNNTFDIRNRDDFRVIYLGAHSKTNALNTLLEAARLVQDRGYANISFHLVGDGPEKGHLIRQAEEMKLNNTKFRQPVPKEGVADVLEEADVLVLTKDSTFGKYSGSILKLFDYMAASKPIVCSADMDYDPITVSNCGFTVPPEDPKALAEAIIKLYMMTPEGRQAMGKRGREYVEKYHSITVLADKLEQVLDEVLK